MSADTLVFDMSSMSEGTPSVFVRKDWLSILDNQNQNYQGNQSVIDTSQLANSNKYMNYREAYLTIPLIMTLTQSVGSAGTYAPATADGTQSPDYVMGLKNWYGSIVHSFTLDYNGTTIIQQTPYCGLWNTFKLMTSLSYNDIVVNGAQLGFYPDDATSFRFDSVATTNGLGTSNNRNLGAFPVVADAFNQFDPYNVGFLRRQQGWNFDPAGIVGTLDTTPTYNTYAGASTAGTLTTTSNLNLLWKSYIFNKVSATNAPTTTAGVVQVAITAQVWLKHLHSFFERVPLLKGVFMKMTLNLNQSSVAFAVSAGGTYTSVAVSSPLGGVSPIMISSHTGNNGAKDLAEGSYICSIAVGKTCLNSTQSSIGNIVQSSPLGGSILLNVPAYTFNPVFETSYLSSPVKKIVYTDIYQYQIVNQISAGQTFNNLITNGIANIKSVLCLPFYQASANAGISPIQSPFDTAGAGTTSPLCLLTQFNIQVSGQNAIYNSERYAYEQFLNQLQGCSAVNGDMTDGLTSSLIDQKQFEMGYCYYYVNVGRMLPVEEAVPKSVNVLGTNMSSKAIDLFIFIEYRVEVSIDILTGARV
jgi:hypothetical protein